MYLKKINVCNSLHTLNFIRFCSNYLLANKRKFLNRKEGTLSSSDDSVFLAEVGNKYEIREPMEAEKRSITFGFKENETEEIKFNEKLKQKQKGKKTGWLEAMNAIRWALDAAGNTGQFIKFSNMGLNQHNEEIEKIKKLHSTFDKEIALLKSPDFEKIIPNNNFLTMDIQTVTSKLNQLLLDKRNSKSRIKTLEEECALAEKELEYQELQIDDISKLVKEIQSKKNRSSKKDNEMIALKTIKKELQHLSKNNNVEELSNAIDSLL